MNEFSPEIPLKKRGRSKGLNNQPKNYLLELFRFIMKNLYKNPNFIHWGREFLLFKNLYKKYESSAFWGVHLHLNYKINSLAFFLTPTGKEKIKEQWNLFFMDRLNIEEENKKIDAKIGFNDTNVSQDIIEKREDLKDLIVKS